MKNWSLRKQIVILALLPALFVGIGLAVYFMNTQIEYIDNTLQKQGESVASQIANAAKYAVISGNTIYFEPALRNFINAPEVVSITIKDINENTLITLKPEDNPLAARPRPFWQKFKTTQLHSFRKPVLAQEMLVNAFDNDSPTDPAQNSLNTSTVGYVELVITSYHSDEQKITSLSKAIMLTVIILVAGFILAVRVSRQIAIPVMLLTDTVRKIASGDFRTRVTQDAPGELGVLESYVNSMADKLQSYHEDMESRIDDFTRELQQTLEELELRNAELDITRSNALAASRAKSEFLANMSHEIRTPLCGIMGFSELIDNTRLDDQQKDYITTIRKSASNLLNIIDDILDLSKIESGKLTITRIEFNLLDVIEEVIDLLSPAAYEKNIELVYNLHKNTTRRIEADPVRIRQVLINLIGNAIKFTDKGYVYLEIQNDTDVHGSGLRFSVTDTGIGMSLSSKQTLFRAFTQADTSITRRFGGTGLGLVISRKLTSLMNGSIDFDSVENEGSRFWFRIPVVAKTDTKEFGDGLVGIRIALAARSELCLSAVRSMLEYWNCEVIPYNIEQPALNNTADMTVSCVTLKDISRLRAGDNICTNITPNKPHIAIVGSNKQDDTELLLKSNINKVVSFASSQKQIFNMICTLVCSSSTNNRCSTVTTTVTSPNWSNVLVLVVDDNAINRRLAEIILQQHNAQVITATSGDAAIQLVKENNFDIIFMDLHMPGMDGYAATRHIRQLQLEMTPKIIALTANAMPAERARIYESGMNDIMIKPINEQMMHTILEKWLVDSTEASPCTPNNVANGVVFSLEEAQKFTSGNTALAIELTTMLKVELPGYQSSIANALNTKNHVELKEQAHKLHGASRCCGTPALREAAENLERVLDEEQFDELTVAVNKLSREITRLLDFNLSCS